MLFPLLVCKNISGRGKCSSLDVHYTQFLASLTKLLVGVLENRKSFYLHLKRPLFVSVFMDAFLFLEDTKWCAEGRAFLSSRFPGINLHTLRFSPAVTSRVKKVRLALESHLLLLSEELLENFARSSLDMTKKARFFFNLLDMGLRLAYFSVHCSRKKYCTVCSYPTVRQRDIFVTN